MLKFRVNPLWCCIVGGPGSSAGEGPGGQGGGSGEGSPGHGDNRTNIEMSGAGMKANAIAGFPGQSMLPISAMTSLYGANAADQQNWAALAANILNTGY